MIQNTKRMGGERCNSFLALAKKTTHTMIVNNTDPSSCKPATETLPPGHTPYRWRFSPPLAPSVGQTAIHRFPKHEALIAKARLAASVILKGTGLAPL